MTSIRKPIRPVLTLLTCCSGLLSGAAEWGEITLDTRLRFESAEQDGKGDADNTSLRLRPGFTTKAVQGFQAMVEGEFTVPFDKNSYNAAGVHGDPQKAVIADPENAQLEQAWLGYSAEQLSLKVGRQVIALDDHRWIGHVGWRQNRQTYDAVSVTAKPVKSVTVRLGYIDNVVRIFGEDAPASGANAGEFGSESTFANLSYAAGAWGTLTGFGYFLDLDDAPGKIAGSDTLGVRYTGSYKGVEGMPLGINLSYANQSDAGGNVQDYSADYLLGELSTTWKGLSLQAGFERLGSDAAGPDAEGNPTYASVKSPLATLHKFNGFADVFLVTPDKGLEDTYVMAGYTFPLTEELGPLVTKIWYHDFSTDAGGEDLGSEIDVVVAKPIPLQIPGAMVFLFKYADFQAEGGGTDVNRLSAELNYTLTF